MRKLKGKYCKQSYKSDFDIVAVSFTSGSYYDSEVSAHMSVPLNKQKGRASHGQ